MEQGLWLEGGPGLRPVVRHYADESYGQLAHGKHCLCLYSFTMTEAPETHEHAQDVVLRLHLLIGVAIYWLQLGRYRED